MKWNLTALLFVILSSLSMSDERDRLQELTDEEMVGERVGGVEDDQRLVDQAMLNQTQRVNDLLKRRDVTSADIQQGFQDYEQAVKSRIEMRQFIKKTYTTQGLISPSYREP